MRSEDPAMALMAYRNTPLDVTGYSPSQLLMGRILRSGLPVLPNTLKPEWPDFKIVRENDDRAKLRTETNFNRIKGARPLQPLGTGDKVRVRLPHDKHWGEPTKIESSALQGSRSSYLVRNRKFLNKIPDPKEFFASTILKIPESPTPLVGDQDPQELNSPSVTTSLSENSGIRTRSGRLSKPVLKYQA